MKKGDCLLVFLFFAILIIGLFSCLLKNTKVEKNVNNQKTYIVPNEIITGNESTIGINEIKQSNIIWNILKEFKELDFIENRKEWFIAYKNIIDKYSYIIEPQQTIYEYFTEEELDLLFRTVQAEVGEECSFEQKCNVVSVIFNRLWHDRFPNELLEILIPSQFSTIKSEKYMRVNVSENTILACEYVFLMGDTTNGSLFFDSNNMLKYKFLFNDGAHNFYTLYPQED